MDLLDGVFGTIAVASATDDRALLDAMCEAETALARACARAGLIELSTAFEIGAACDTVRAGDPADLGRRAVAGGNPVIPLVEQLRDVVRERAGDDTARAVHLGATSQDILDTALMMIAKQAGGVVLAELADAAGNSAGLARQHRDTPMLARTLLQPAVPTTFGALAAVWGTALDTAQRRLATTLATLPASLGGAAGTLAGWHPHGFAVVSAFADELGLAEPNGVWHADRAPVHDLAGSLGAAAASVAKIAGDIVLLSQHELAEVREGNPGGSSAMAHKQNPIAAVTARAAAAQAPGHVRDPARRDARTAARCGKLARGMARPAGPAAVYRRRGVTPADVPANAAGRCNGDGAQSRRDEATLDIADTGHAADLVDRYLERRSP